MQKHKKSQLPQTLTIISEVKQNNLNPEQNILEKSKNLVDGVVSGGGVKAEAQHYYYAYRWEAKREWWRLGIRIPQSFIEPLEYEIGRLNLLTFVIGGIAQVTGMLNKTRKIVAVCTFIPKLCTVLAFMIFAFYHSFTSYNKYVCKSEGTWIYRNTLDRFAPSVPSVHILGATYFGCH